MSRVLVFGGAFNPPTIAHIQCAKYVKDTLKYDFVIFVPTKREYVLEEQKKDFSFTNEQRLEMLQEIAKKNPWMLVEEYEMRCEKQPRTYDTLCYLRNKGYDATWLFGSDKLLELETGWKFVEEIAKEFGFVCMSRNGEDVGSIISHNTYLSSLKQYITMIETPSTLQMVSSSEVRRYLMLLQKDKNNQQIKDILNSLLPEEIQDREKWV